METEIKTHEDLKNALLEVMDFADDTPTKGNPRMTKGQFWDILIGYTLGNEDKKVSEITITNFYREFPKHLID